MEADRKQYYAKCHTVACGKVPKQQTVRGKICHGHESRWHFPHGHLKVKGVTGGYDLVGRTGLRQGSQVPGNDVVAELNITSGQDMDFCVSQHFTAASILAPDFCSNLVPLLSARLVQYLGGESYILQCVRTIVAK